MRILLASLIILALLGQVLSQSSVAPSEVLNKLDLAYAGAPLITGDFCSYMWHREFNTLLTICHNSEGMLVGN